MGRQTLLAQTRREKQDLEFQVEPTLALVGLVQQIRQGCGIALRSAWLSDPERRQGLRRDDPGRDGAGEVLGQERTERLVFPRLDVACRPIVQQAVARNVFGGLGDGDRFTESVARTDPDPKFQLVVEPLTGAEARR